MSRKRKSRREMASRADRALSPALRHVAFTKATRDHQLGTFGAASEVRHIPIPGRDVTHVTPPREPVPKDGGPWEATERYRHKARSFETIRHFGGQAQGVRMAQPPVLQHAYRNPETGAVRWVSVEALTGTRLPRGWADLEPVPEGTPDDE